MSSPHAVALRALAMMCFLVASAALGHAQCPVPEPDDLRRIPRLPEPKPAPEEPILPEAGFLSNTHYTSQFFGFSFDLPLTVQGHEIMMPVMPEKEHALLALQYEEGRRKGYIMVTAYDPLPGFDAKTPEQRERELREWSQIGTAAGGLPQVAIPPSMLKSAHFYHQFRHRGGNYAAQYWSGINNYMVKVVVGTNDAHFLRKAQESMAAVHFYCPQDDGTLRDENGRPVKLEGRAYAGPTVPTFRVNAALRDEPAKNIPRGKVADGVYRNPDIGLQYELPQGWKAQSGNEFDPPLEPAAIREYQFLHACSQTLLQLAPEGHAAGGSSDPAIVLRALDPNCLSMRTAASLGDKRAVDKMAASLEELGEFGEIGWDELRSISDHLFMVFHGTIASSSRGEGLAERLSQTIFATRYNKLLLVWSFMAPTTSALDELPTGGITFEGSPPIQLRITEAERAGSIPKVPPTASAK